MVRKCNGNNTTIIIGGALLGGGLVNVVIIIINIDPIKRSIYRIGQIEKIPNTIALPFVIFLPFSSTC
jgi:hypothetical protein